jgi:hypothetical protein
VLCSAIDQIQEIRLIRLVAADAARSVSSLGLSVPDRFPPGARYLPGQEPPGFLEDKARLPQAPPAEH